MQPRPPAGDAGLDALSPEVRDQLETLGYDPERQQYSPAEVVESTTNGLMTVDTFLHRAFDEPIADRRVA